MPAPSFGQIPTMNVDGASVDQLRAYVKQLQDHLIRMQRDMNYLFQHLDTENIMEIGGWRVGSDELASKDGDVGMSTKDTGADDIRFFAGAPGGDKNTAPWRVTKGGKMNATGAQLESAAGYPKAVFDPENNQFAVYSSADDFLALIPDQDGAPAIGVFEGGFPVAILQMILGDLHLFSNDGRDIRIIANGDLWLKSSGGGKVILEGGTTGSFTTSSGTVTVRNGIVTSIV